MPAVQLIDDPDFDFALRCLLAGASSWMADSGEILAAAGRVAPGDRTSWVDAFDDLAGRCDRAAADADAVGDRFGASRAFLRAANYRFAAWYYVLASDRAGEHLAMWRAHRRSALAAFERWDTPVEPFTFTANGHTLAAWRFHARSAAGGAAEQRPLMVVHNGLGSPLSDVLMTGVLDAVEQGWDAVAFDGPGQGSACFEQGLAPVDNWGAVGVALLDTLMARGGVDPARVVAAGIADGGYLAALHAASDARVTALVADPGVLRPLDGALGMLPAVLTEAWWAGRGDAVAVAVREAAGDPAVAFSAAKLCEQWPGHGPGEVLERLAGWDLGPRLADLRCPVVLCDPDGAFFNQSAELATALGPSATRLVFRADEGAGMDCEIGASRLRNLRVFGYLHRALG